MLAVAAIAGGVRFWDLSQPHGVVFDEVYYPKAACIYLGWSDRVCEVNSSDEKYWREHEWDVGSWVHPPLGKWTMAMGIEVFGMRDFGWRFMSALEGTLIAVFVAMMAQMLFARPVWTFVAGLLLAVEDLNVVMSRVGLLDIHLAFWVTLGFLFLLLDRRWIERRTPHEPVPMQVPGPDGTLALVTPRWSKLPSPVWRPWRFAAGAALGAACAVKWSGITALVAAVVISYVWETSRRHRGDTGWGRAFGRAVALETFGLALALLIVPAAIYLAAWIPWFNHFGWNLSAWWHHQADMWRYHAELKATALEAGTDHYTPTHPYYSRPWTWLIPLRPVSFYVKDLGPDIRQILAIGNPAILIASLVSIPFTGLAWWRQRDWRAGFVLLPFLIQYLAWFAVSRPQFFFYLLPCTPFMVLSVTYMLRMLSDLRLVIRDEESGQVAINPETGAPAVSERHLYRPVVWIYLLVAVGMFVWFFPVLTGMRISDAHWRAIVWFRGWV